MIPQMTLRYLILFPFFFCFSCSSNNNSDELANEEKTENTNEVKPNILLVIADDMGIDATPRYPIGTVKPNMPNLESLMDNGIKFHNVWSYAVCSPTRASILTGKYGFRTNVTRVGQTLSTNETSIQRYLDVSNTGYTSAVIGKWHLSNNLNHPTSLAIETFAGIIGGGVPSYWNWNLVENGQSKNSQDYTTTKLTDLAIDWINNQTQPWFLWMAYNAPHTPFHLPDANLHYQGNLPSDQASIDANPVPYYMAMLEAMDTEMGRLINSLSSEEKENTVIIFIGDNGTPNQVVQDYPRRRAKNSIYEGGIRVPMVVSGKGIDRKGVEENALVNSTDLFATIASIAGIEVDEINDSKSFMPLFTSSGIVIRDYAFAELNSGSGLMDYAVRNETYKYIAFSNGSEAFYNLILDPLETSNKLNASQTSLSPEETEYLETLKANLSILKQ